MAVEREDKPILVREVMRPGREQTGVAVLLVAASALTFALAGSAFALWARTAHRCNHVHPPIATQVSDAEPAVISVPPLDSSCGAAQWSQNPDSSVTVQFQPCESPALQIEPAGRVEVEERADGVIVYRIVH